MIAAPKSVLLGLCLASAAACGSDSDGAGFDAGIAADASQDSQDSSYLFDESTIRTYEVEIAEEDWQWLNDNALLEQYRPAKLIFEGKTIENVAMRFKGSVGSLRLCFDNFGNRLCDKLSIKLKFSEYDPDGRFFGLKRINFHSMEGDPTKMHDSISYKLFRDRGVPAPRTSYARFVVNGELIGLYTVVEQIDGRFTRRVFPDGGEGNLYKEVWPSFTTEEPYLSALKTNEDESPSADKMVRFAGDLMAAGEEGFASVIDSWMDRDALVQYMAVARLIDSWDDIVAWYCGGEYCGNHNYYWYESSTEDKVWLIAWDTDHTFEEPSPIRTYYGMPDWDDLDADCTPIDIFLNSKGRAPACDPFIRGMATQLWDDYQAASEALLAGDFSTAAMNQRIDAIEATIEDAIAEDPNGPSLAGWRSSVDSLRAIVEIKRNYILEKFE